MSKINMNDILLAKAMATSAAKAYTDNKTAALMGGMRYKGSVSYYDDLPSDAEEGDAYTVKYAGTSGSNPDGTEYVWGLDSDTNTLMWISFSKDSYSKAETDALLAPEQAKTVGMTAGGSNYITVGGIRVYVSATAPTGDIPDGSVGVGW